MNTFNAPRKKVFSHLLAFVVLSFIGIQSTNAQSIESFYDGVDNFLADFAEDGLVDYGAIAEQPAELDALVGMIASLDRGALSADHEKAFLINAYNILVIKNVVDNYPTNSPLEVNGFFDRAKFEVSGTSYTLNELEKGDLFKAYPDARLHFVLVCAAIGCPELIAVAYRAETLDELLDERTRAVLNNEKHVRTNESSKRHEVSELFTWYKSDFTTDGMDVIDYINQYRTEPLEEGYKLGSITYDWQLNDVKKKS